LILKSGKYVRFQYIINFIYLITSNLYRKKKKNIKQHNIVVFQPTICIFATKSLQSNDTYEPTPLHIDPFNPWRAMPRAANQGTLGIRMVATV
jgi:hypothetical protein